jgi:cell division protein FtsI (penicillin-binding protein 3)
MRFWLICLFFLVWACAIASRLFWLQIVRHQEFVERAQKQQQRTFEVAPRRGVLYDRNLRELAMTVQVDSIYAVPPEIDDKQTAAHALAALVHTDPGDAPTTEEQIAARLTNGRSFAWVARRVTPEVAARVRALTGSGAGSIKGIYFTKEFQRFYPDNEIAAQVLGYVGVDDNGLGGLEQKYEAQLHGVPGRMYTAMDAHRKVLGSSEREPEPGQNLVLTIDGNIQFLAERALDHAMQRTQAENGTVVVQDVHTGQILALAIRPTFNPNSFRRTTPELLRNHAVSDVYEPGSTFKLVTYAAALEQHVASPDDIIDCQGGQITLGASQCTRRWSTPVTWPPSSWRSRWGRSGSISSFATSASARVRALRCPAKPAACCVRSTAGAPRPSAPSPLARRLRSRPCNWFRWYRPSQMEESTCRHTC